MKNEIAVNKLIGYIEKIQCYTKDMQYNQFIQSDLVIEACVFNLSQIGELSHKIDENYKKMHTRIPWRELYGLRNRIVHDYEGVNMCLVWEIIRDDLPQLKERLLLLK